VGILTDEILMSYADSELAREDRARVDVMLARDPESLARLEIFRSTGAPLAALYKKPMLEPVPANLVSFVLNHDANTAGKRVEKAARLKPSPFTWWQRLIPDQPRWQMAFAAAAMVVAGTGLGWGLHSWSGTEGSAHRLVAFAKGDLFATGVLEHVLETLPSGQEATIEGAAGDAVAVRVNLTFKSKSESYCREYEVATVAQGRHAGLSCRDGTGKWAILVNLPSKDVIRRGGQMVPAGDAAVPVIDAIVDRVMDGDAFGRNEELTLISGGWR
jgi:anti-sigma factor RsiW